MLIFLFKTAISLSLLACVTAGACFIFGSVLLQLQSLPASQLPWLIYFLPLISLLLIWLRKQSFWINLKTTDFIQNKTLDFHIRWQFLWITTLTWLSQLFGASVGRESTALQIGGSLSSWIKPERSDSAKIQLSIADYRHLGMMMGFSALFGTPFAAVFFILELTKKWTFPIFMWGLFSSGISYFMMRTYGGKALHLHLEMTSEVPATASLLLDLIILALSCGFVAWLFTRAHHLVSRHSKIKTYFISSLLLVLCFTIWNQSQLTGLSLDAFAKSYQTSSPNWFFLQKMIVTLLSHASGFLGGEVTPLFVIGSSLGSNLAHHLGQPIDLFAAAGLVALFAGVTRAPIASFLIGYEIFGATHSWAYVLVIFISLRIASRQGLYSLS